MKNSLLFSLAALSILCITAFEFSKLDNNTTTKDKVECTPKKFVESLHCNSQEYLYQNRPYCEPKTFVTVSHCSSPKYFPQEDLVYNVDQRFKWDIGLEDAQGATNLSDLLPEKISNAAEEYYKLEISNWPLTRMEINDDTVLTPAQMDIVKAAGYGDNLRVTAYYRVKDVETGKLVSRDQDYFNYMITVMPENEAAYTEGKDALIKYLRKNSRRETAKVDAKLVKSCKIQFTVTAEGKVANANLESTSGYPDVDEFLLKLIEDIPGQWQVATDGNGKKVNQKLCFSFGNIGC